MRVGALLNSSLGDYRLVDFVGAGGMGEVYRAIHNKLGRVVAIKVLKPESVNDNLIQRFQNEARIQARLNHPGISTLYDFVEVNGQNCIIMEYVDGSTLSDRIAACGSVPVEEAINVFKSVAEAISYIHSNGIIHRDIKPNNIKINSAGVPKLLDFGIAKSLSSPGLTMIGDVIGTLQYLSPEQLRGSSADERSDIWALGVLLYETVSGHVPFEAATIGELYEKISKSDQVPASTLNREVPKDVELIISRCLKKNPASRYQSVRELREDVALLNWGNVEDSVSGRRARSARSIQRIVSWRTAVAALALLVTFCFVAYFAIEYWPKPDVSGKTVESKHDEPVESQSDAARTNAFAGNSNAETRSVLIRLWQGTAEVYRDEKLVGHTPYPVEGALGTKVNLTLKQPGYEDYNLEVTVTENTKDYFIPMHAKSDEGKE